MLTVIYIRLDVAATEVSLVQNIYLFYLCKLDYRHGVTMIYERWNHSQAPPKKPTPPVIYQL